MSLSLIEAIEATWCGQPQHLILMSLVLLTLKSLFLISEPHLAPYSLPWDCCHTQQGH